MISRSRVSERRPRILAPAVICLAIASAGAAFAQVKAYQGKPKQEPVQEFDSPMILELEVPGLGDLSPGESRGIGGPLRRFVCDDASIHTLRVERGRDRKRGGRRETSLVLEGMVHVRESYDRLVNLELTLAKGTRVFAEQTVYRIDAEEEKYRKFKATLALSFEDFDELITGDPVPHLKIVMSVFDNK